MRGNVFPRSCVKFHALRISLENRGKIIALAEEQYSHREFAARVGCSHGAVGEIVRKHRLTVSVTDRKIPGRGRKTTARQDRVLVRKSLADRFKTAPQVKAEMLLEHGVDISTSTAQRRLREGVAWTQSQTKATPHSCAQESTNGIRKGPQRLDSFSVGTSRFK